MTWSQWAWLFWGAYFLTVEGYALANSRAGDTLSEHVWAFLGLRVRATRYDDEHPARQHVGPRVASGWTKARRVLVISFMVWLTLHFATGGTYV